MEGEKEAIEVNMENEKELVEANIEGQIYCVKKYARECISKCSKRAEKANST